MRRLLVLMCLGLGCQPSTAAGPASQPAGGASAAAGHDKKAIAPAPAVPAGHETAIFAGGCFWCLETAFEGLPGVDSVTSGYSGGHVKNPSYQQVGRGGTGHAEVVMVVFDPKTVTYDQLLTQFWLNIDPTTKDRQFCDWGDSYRPEIFVQGKAQRAAAEKSLAEVKKTKPFDDAVVVPVTDAGPFYPAENYHQDFYKKEPAHYQRYRTGCGRDARLRQLWGKKAGGIATHH